MQTSGYVALSGQIALEQRMTALANNVANSGTAGYRAEGVRFESVVSRVSPVPTSFAVSGGTHVMTSSGGMVKTGNPLDVAIQGEGFMAVQTPGGSVYTRDGRMQILNTGGLVSLNGYPVLDVGGAPITLDPAAGTPHIARDGMISQGGRQVGAIGLFVVDLSKPYRRFENSGFIPSSPPDPIVTFASNGVAQGFIENSNVNPVLEMTNLVKVTRAFEALASALEQNDASLRSAVQTLGSRS
jgi:flagellar basal-body rod protein FlgF